MSWRLSADAEAFAARARPLLAADPVEQTLALTILAGVRRGTSSSSAEPLFGWLEAAGEVRGAVLMVPPYELQLALVPPGAVGSLVDALRARGTRLPGVHGETGDVDRFAAAWTAASALETRPLMAMRLFRLAALRPPAPGPGGRGRAAGAEDEALAVEWARAFYADSPLTPGDAERTVRERLPDRRLWLWEDGDGVPVALAGRSGAEAGVARINTVYTPPERRRRGYGAAVTAACAGDALARGVRDVVLFADLANPTSNSIYRRVGFVPVSDRRIVRFV